MADTNRPLNGEESAWTLDALKQYFESAREDQRRALMVAEQEREKAAKALREELQRTIIEGDRNLRDHIENQIEQIKAALASAEKLEVERIGAVAQQIEGVASEIKIGAEASNRAIAKAEVATEKRLEGLNELRQMVTDAQRQFMPREVADAQFSELRRAIADLTEKISKL